MSTAPSWVTSLFCPILGLFITSTMWLSPMKLVLRARKDRELREINAIPFAITFFNCIGWTMYGCVQGNIFVFLGNCPGMVLGAFYSLSCLTLLSVKKLDTDLSDSYLILERILLGSLLFWGIVGYVAKVGFPQYPTSEGNLFIGYLACAGGISYYAAPCSTMAKVLRLRDASSLDAPTICVNATNGALWFFYGLFAVQDIFIWAPNGLGVVLAFIQLSLVALYRKKSVRAILVREPTSRTPLNRNVSENIFNRQSSILLFLTRTTGIPFETLPDELAGEENEKNDVEMADNAIPGKDLPNASDSSSSKQVTERRAECTRVNDSVVVEKTVSTDIANPIHQ